MLDRLPGHSGGLEQAPEWHVRGPLTDPNMMEMNKHREIRRCYNCEEIDYLAARYSKPRKEKKKEVRITEEIIEDFSLGRK